MLIFISSIFSLIDQTLVSTVHVRSPLYETLNTQEPPAPPIEITYIKKNVT